MYAPPDDRTPTLSAFASAPPHDPDADLFLGGDLNLQHSAPRDALEAWSWPSAAFAFARSLSSPTTGFHTGLLGPGLPRRIWILWPPLLPGSLAGMLACGTVRGFRTTVVSSPRLALQPPPPPELFLCINCKYWTTRTKPWFSLDARLGFHVCHPLSISRTRR